MTRIPIIILLLLGAVIRPKAQSTFMVLHLNENLEFKKVAPKKAVQSDIYNITRDPQSVTTVTLYNKAGRCEYLDYNNETSHYSVKRKYVYDTANKLLLSEVMEVKTFSGVRIDSVYYGYDSGQHLVRILYKNEAGKITQITQITNNEKGHPILITDIDSNGVQMRKETAFYVYERNRAFVSMYAKDGSVMRQDSLKINHKNAYLNPEPGEVYDEQGFLSVYMGKLPDGTRLPFETHTVYDANGNWIEKKTYEIISPNGKKEKVLTATSKREYTY
jgi:5S rRNA maturation endonuclease (ribonuclease M5)